VKLKTWQEYVSDGVEALIIAAIIFLGLVPGVPSHDWEVAIAFGVVKAMPNGIVAQAINTIKGGTKPDASKNPTP
jgi:hypothetical protein